MRKFLFSFLLTLVMLVPNFVYAEYQTLLNGDRNVILTGGHMGYGVYLVRNSVQVSRYTENGIILKFDTIGVSNADNDRREIGNRNVNYYYYKKTEDQMYAYSESSKQWHYIKPVGSMAETGHFYPGELAYCFAFGKPYYGGKQWFDSSLGKYTDAACSEMYELYLKYR